MEYSVKSWTISFNRNDYLKKQYCLFVYNTGTKCQFHFSYKYKHFQISQGG